MVPLEPCTLEHFSKTDQLKDNFNKMYGQTKMCPPLNYSSSIEGKYSLGINWVEVRVSKCGSLYNNSIPCANQTQVDDLINTWGELLIDFFFIKPIINPGNTEYLDY